MSFNGAFTISQGTDPHSFTLTDTSSGSDTNLTDRKIYLYKSDGTTLVTQGSSTTWIDWPIANNTITISLLDRDYCLNIEVDWISSSPLVPPSTYTLTILKNFTSNSESFYSGKLQEQSANPLLVDDNHWYENMSKLRLFIDNSMQAAVIMNNIFLAQQNLDKAYNFIQNENTYF